MDGSVGTAERRRAKRQGMLKRAQIAAGQTLFDCCILDSSEHGVRIETPMPMRLPDNVVLRLQGELAIAARRCWSRGTEAGLEFAVEDRGALSDAATRAWAIHAVLADGHVDVALRKLRDTRFFDDEALREAAEAAEVARMRLAGALRAFALGRS